jgi:hypothetical protein
MKYYKVLDHDRRPIHGGAGQYPPPGEWTDRIPDIRPCHTGYHLCRRQDLVLWLGPCIWEVDAADGATIIECDDKVVTTGPVALARKLPWDDRIARLFACDCAERVVHLCGDDPRGDDPRPRQAIDTARRYAEGEATDEELHIAAAAARAAAWDAARAAAWAAAWDAARKQFNELALAALKGAERWHE